ncbi:ABC transporter permease [Puniceibacterium sp. IMCC21224]|uniref:ABC transporter permease n=1 Tax=Puniceibacterium sp. IMCC21224 TaxID=1618204 RepID=UPI00064D9048|nr:ABC transporter permease [Puniceibacterium sp. IMCC21224]KMK66226.1 FtsX-like permease family [Puniceibacterium sp. IMCC21224]
MTRTVLSALLSHWRRHPVQLVTLLLGLALATALWSGVQAINAEARNSYSRAASTLGQEQPDWLEGPVTLDAYIALRRAGWLVSPVVEGELQVAGVNLRLLGVDPLTAPPQPGMAALAAGDSALADFIGGKGRLLVAPETAKALTDAALPPRLIAADVPVGTAVTDIAVALRLLGTDQISRLLLAGDQPMGVAPLAQVTSLRRVTPPDGTDLAQLTDSFHLNLTAFGLLSFAVGLFIVQSAIGLAFEQRRPTFRTLRALGVDMRRLMLLLAVELLILAVVAGGIGVALGYGIAATLLPGVAGTLRGLYGAEVSGTLGFDPLWAVSALAITLLGTAAAGAQALWRVARMPLLAPAQPRAWARASVRVLRAQGGGAALLLLCSLALAVWGDGLTAGFACIAALLIGAALALPALLIAALDLAAGRMRGPLGEWLFADARQQVPALSLALMALLLALAANIGVGTMVGSFRATFVGWLDQRLASELYVTARDDAQSRAIRDWLIPRADAVLPVWSIQAQVRGAPTEIYGVANHTTYRDNWPLLSALPDVWNRLAAGDGVLINEQLFRREALTLGDTLELATGWAPQVLGVYSDYGNPRGQLIAGTDMLAKRYPAAPQLRWAVRVAQEQTTPLANALRDRFDLPALNVVDQATIKRRSIEVFDQTFLVSGALNVLTLGVAGFAMLTSLLTLSALRLPQLAPVWALGLPPRRLAGFEVARTALLALFTFLLAVPVGLALAWVLLAIVNVQAFGWRLPMTIFPGDWLRLGLLALIAALLASAWPVVRLMRLPPSQLLRVFAHDR